MRIQCTVGYLQPSAQSVQNTAHNTGAMNLDFLITVAVRKLPCWFTPGLPGIRRLRKEDCGCEANLDYMGSGKPA